MNLTVNGGLETNAALKYLEWACTAPYNSLICRLVSLQAIRSRPSV
jgi:hypothetical protein